jgi:hypothetical protein
MNDKESIKEILSKLGFSLLDRGSYWQTKAIWRDGDNPTSIQVYKDSGVWNDYARGVAKQPFGRLVRLASGGKFDEKSLDFLNREPDSFRDEKVRIEMEEHYPVSLLKKLLPQHNFYTEKGIMDKTLSLYRSGYATQGKMSRRYVFPIFDVNNPDKIIGFTGRSIYWKSDSTFPKWKHIGRKSSWIYPLCTPVGKEFPFLDAVRKTKQIYIVESVGDSLALTERGIMNHMVTFGLPLSSKQIAKLVELGPNEIIISSNNDVGKAVNSGRLAAIKNYFKLISFFDVGKLIINLCPPNKDLSDIQGDEEEFLKWLNKQIDRDKQMAFLLNELRGKSGIKIVANQKERFKKVKLLSSICGEDEWN